MKTLLFCLWSAASVAAATGEPPPAAAPAPGIEPPPAIVPPPAPGRPVFARMDADQDNRVSPGEYLLFRQAWFAEADADGEGTLTADEHLKARQSEWKAMDVNGDGAVVIAEYLAFYGGPDPAPAPAPAPPTAARPASPTLFETLDADGNGYISRPECAAYWTALFRQADTSGDGTLTPEEMAEGAGRQFAALDADTDHRVSRAEAVAHAVPEPRGTPGAATNLPPVP